MELRNVVGEYDAAMVLCASKDEVEDLEEEDLEELEEDRGVRGDLPGHPSGRDADDRTNEEDPETGKTGNVGPKYKIAREQVDIGEVLNYLLETGVSK